MLRYIGTDMVRAYFIRYEQTPYNYIKHHTFHLDDWM